MEVIKTNYKGNLSLFLFLLALALGLCGPLCAGPRNGKFGVPSFRDLVSLDQAKQDRMRQAFPSMGQNDFVETHIKGPSFYYFPEGINELRHSAEFINNLLTEKNYAEVYFVGRSPMALMAFMLGQQYAGWRSYKDTELKDLPFSYSSEFMITKELRAGLRRHLEANGLSPKQILKDDRPRLFVDFVFSAKGVGKLLSEIVLWANEENVGAEVKARLEFCGFYPAEMLVEEQQRGFVFSTLKEMRGGSLPDFNSDEWRHSIQKKAEELSMPGDFRIRDHTSRIHSQRISRKFYIYAGTHGPTVQESFSRAHWSSQDLGNSLSFSSWNYHKGLLDLFYVFEKGQSPIDSALNFDGAVLGTDLIPGAANSCPGQIARASYSLL